MRAIISIKNIGKRYRLGFIRKEDTIRDKIQNGIKEILRLQEKNNHQKVIEEKNEFWALKDISFDLFEGDVCGIIGRNGAGKSTLLKILSRITNPSEGEIKISGRVGSLLEVGTGFHPELSGRENIFMNGSILGMTKSEIKSKFDEIVEFAEVQRFIDTPVKRYSSGMYVKLAFAVAAHLEPEILIVDEVLAVGDVEFQKKCIGKMKDVSGSGRTIIFVSHNMSAIRSLVNKCALIERGSLAFIGDTNECINNYLNQFSKDDGQSSIRFPNNILSPKKPIVIKEIRLLCPERGETNTFFIGETWAVEILIESMNENVRFQLDVEIQNQDGIKICHLVMTDSGVHSLVSKKGKNRVRVSLEKLNFYPGKYFISIWCGSAGKGRIDYAYMQSIIAFSISSNHNDAIKFITKQNNVQVHDLTKSRALIFNVGQWEIIQQ